MYELHVAMTRFDLRRHPLVRVMSPNKSCCRRATPPILNCAGDRGRGSQVLNTRPQVLEALHEWWVTVLRRLQQGQSHAMGGLGWHVDRALYVSIFTRLYQASHHRGKVLDCLMDGGCDHQPRVMILRG